MSATTHRRGLLAAAGLLAVPSVAMAQASAPRPRITVISQWSAGSDGAAISRLGEVFTAEGGVWEHNPVPGFTTEMMNKLRADILAGNPPAASQLKGPEIAAWSRIAPTVDLTQLVAAAGYEQVVAPDLARLHKPQGRWAALPLQVYRTNTLFASRRAMERVGATALPKTWAEFNDLAARMKAAGITPVANGGIRWDDGQKFECALAGINPATYRKAIMELDDGALRGAEVLGAFRQLRMISEWMDPAASGQHYSTFLPRFVRGEMGMLMMGGWAQGVIRHAGFSDQDYLVGQVPVDNGRPCFVLNADAFIFWRRREPEFQAGQTLMANLVMSPRVQEMYSQITGSIPVRTDMDLSGAGWSTGQREAAASLAAAVQAGQSVLSLAHNMAQTNQMSAAMIDVLTEFVHNRSLRPEQGQQRLAEAVEAAR
ncbi:carbohydrate ABC transporter substrate-binding protein [Roseomonas hellenica]|uniref:Carbohydrate ABC transporter substrate-binding protein n=1 Tax=Plastoroseomonas hellenica TaxID=2687306 RepID=A0ABS5EVM3_9PROT|nr:ABC transporter substrate-binding protein [Plastoroseomonas hellenica]MBR0664336.1 carbohydrate ABC transporter substrate-binding protein [Plastoroseomonas hellenica]